jgi:hypothetical protein
MKCPTGSYKENGVCVPIHRCPNGSRRRCVSQLKEHKERVEIRSRDNELLKEVIADYEDMFEKLKLQKKRQEDQLLTILQHIKQIHEENFLSKTGLLHLQHEQEQLIARYKEIKDSVHSELK